VVGFQHTTAWTTPHRAAGRQLRLRTASIVARIASASAYPHPGHDQKRDDHDGGNHKGPHRGASVVATRLWLRILAFLRRELFLGQVPCVLRSTSLLERCPVLAVSVLPRISEEQ
jgi:hypothetical protein